MEVVRVHNLAGECLSVPVSFTSRWQLEVKEGVSRAWHIAPPCQQLLHGSLVLHGTEQLHDVFDEGEDWSLVMVVSVVELSRRLVSSGMSQREEKDFLEMAGRIRGFCREGLVRALIGHLSGKVSTRRHALRVLSMCSEGCEDLVFDAVQSCTDDDDLSVREAAVVALANLVEIEGSVRNVVALAAQQGNSSYRVRVRVFREMGRVVERGNAHAIKATADLLEHHAIEIRAEAAVRMGSVSGMGNPQALAAVEARLKHQEAGVRCAAIVAMGHLDARSLEAVVACLRDPDQSVVRAARTALTRMGVNHSQ